MLNIIAVFMGGGIGAVVRYLTTLISCKYLSNSCYATFGVNVIGCLLIGYILGIVLYKSDIINPTLKLFLTVGLLGGLTTFSTFSWEAFLFVKEGKFIHALIYALSSLILGLVATYIGFNLSKLVN